MIRKMFSCGTIAMHIAIVIACIGISGCDDSDDTKSSVTPATSQDQASPATSDAAPNDPASVAQAELDTCNSNLSVAREKFLEHNKPSKEYLRAQADADAKEKVYREIQKTGSIQDKLDAGSAWHLAQGIADKMQTNAISSDPEIQRRLAEQRAAIANLAQARTAEGALRIAQAKDAATAEAAEQERIYNDPTNVAVREHRLVEGMTYEQAKEAVGLPYSVTQSSSILLATWEFGEGNFWSAEFDNGIVISVSNTRI